MSFLESPRLEIKGRCLLKKYFEIVCGSSFQDTLPPNISEVLNTDLNCRLLRSGLPKIKHLETLKELGIERIISLQECEQTLQTAIEEGGFGHTTIQLMSKRITAEEINLVIRTLRQDTRATLLHCIGGADRTGIVIAAMRAQQNWNTKEISREMIRNCHIPFPKFQYVFDRLLPHFLNAQLEIFSETDSRAGADGGLHR